MTDIFLRDAQDGVRGFRTEENMVYSRQGVTAFIVGFWTEGSDTLLESDGEYFIPFDNIAYINRS